MEIFTLIIFIIILYFAYVFMKYLIKNEEIKYQEPSCLKLVKLYTEEGTLLETYEKVYLEHWDKNIYRIYDKKDGNLIIRIDKGANMLLTSTNVD